MQLRHDSSSRNTLSAPEVRNERKGFGNIICDKLKLAGCVGIRVSITTLDRDLGGLGALGRTSSLLYETVGFDPLNDESLLLRAPQRHVIYKRVIVFESFKRGHNLVKPLTQLAAKSSPTCCLAKPSQNL